MSNGKPEEDGTTWSKSEMEAQDKTKTLLMPHSCTGMVKIYRDWKTILQLARQFMIFRLPATNTHHAEIRPALLIEDTTELEKLVIERVKKNQREKHLGIRYLVSNYEQLFF